MKITSGVCEINLEKDLEENIRCQTGLCPFNGKVIAYKQVRNNLSSFKDTEFIYEIGKIAKVDNPNLSNKSCASGLHFSNANYWNLDADILNSTFLIAEIKLKDIITVQEGKIRCKKAKILGSYKIKEK